MWEVLYHDLVGQVGGPIGAFVLVSGWLAAFGLGRGIFFFYSELSSERKLNQELNNKMMEQANAYRESVNGLQKIIDEYQDKENWRELITTLNSKPKD